MKNLVLALSLLLVLLSASVWGATLTGSIYNSKLDLESNVLVKINTIPEQKILSKDGTYKFEIPTGSYTLDAKTADLSVSEKIEITSDGEYQIDLFLMPDLSDEEDLWNDVSQENLVEDVYSNSANYLSWIIGIIGIVVLVLGAVLLWANKKKAHPTDKKENEEMPIETTQATEVVPLETLETLSSDEHKEELANEPSYLYETIDIIQKHGGRIYQKELRKEMMHLSESKISLILTELEHNGKIEKIKKGRGNAIILK